MVSGGVLILLSIVYVRTFMIDPIDSMLIIHEQAINLSSKHSNNVQRIIEVDTFIENCIVPQTTEECTGASKA